MAVGKVKSAPRSKKLDGERDAKAVVIAAGTSVKAIASALESTAVVRKPELSVHSTAYIRKRMYRTQRRHVGVCIKYRPMRRIVKSITARDAINLDDGSGITQVTEGAVRHVQELVEHAVISVLRQSIERREENGGKKLMEQNLLNAFLAWASFQKLDFVHDFADLARALGWSAKRPKLTQQDYMNRALSVRPFRG